MDNITPLVHGTKSICNITLNDYQHAFYALYGLADLMYRVQEFCDKNKD